MHISRIELENIKSHAESTFEFLRGTTAVTGENGAGKTTLIEAVAWTLFDVLDYKKDDFVRRGEKKGVARVTFESGLDEREYTVYRDTGTGYYVYDPQLKLRIADKKEEVCRFLWQHLGVEPGTDLDSLYRRAIGVPQGTFTSIFLETAAERKKAFDKLLKVEEYRRGADELLRTVRYVEQQIAEVNVKIARAEGELGRIELIEEEFKTASMQAATLSAELEKLEADVAAKTELVSGLDEKEKRVKEAQTARDAARSRLSQAEIVLRHKESELEQAREAARTIEKVKGDAERHNAALGRLRELERERSTRDKLRGELTKIETSIAAVKANQKNVAEQLENSLKAHKAIELLIPRAAEEERLFERVEDLRNRVAHARAAKSQMASLDEKIGRLRESYRANQALLTEAISKTNGAKDLGELETREASIVRELARLQASLERDEKFQSEIKNGLCPILSQKCLNLEEGETLDGFLSSQFVGLKTEIESLQDEHEKIVVALKSSRNAEKYSAQLEAYRVREKEIANEGTQLKEERESLEKEADDLGSLETELIAAEAQLKSLDNPKTKIKFLEAEGRREFELRDQLSNIESNLERLESDRRIKVEQLESYKDLDEQLAGTSRLRDETEQAHRTLLANEAAAATVPEREKGWEESKAALAESTDALTAAERELESATKDYDAEVHMSERARLFELHKRQVEIRANLETARRRQSQLEGDLKRLEETRKALQDEYREKERLEKVHEATEFIRSTLKDAAPLVARNYVHRVSLEANQMFREITGNAERTLKWADDYGIFLEESGYDRPFINLSGGEQMAAALAVRLALLKQLSEIRIAFFDEPTTNMDAERRENLAIQISQIKHFDQLFVISHDDTFEGYVDNVVAVERLEV
jgi:DNA repair protein SbcC/Rad50